MKGKLTDQPLAELVREISSKSLSGTLRLKNDPVQSAVYFSEGELVFAASNLRTLRLRAYLEKLPSITPETLNKAGNVPDLQLLSILKSQNLIRVDEVDVLLASLVTDILRMALLWEDGTWEFDQRARFAEEFRVRLRVPNLLREAAHRVPETLVVSRFLNPNEIFARAPKSSPIKGLLEAESLILSRLDEPMILENLVAVSGLRDREAFRIIYGLALSGCITREYWHNAFRTEAPKGAPDNKEKDSLDRPDEEVDLEQFLNRINRADDYYEILDLPLKAEAAELKEAYYKLARRYHPDRFHLKSGTALHTNLVSAFAKVTQAYETLMNPSARASYDVTLEKKRAFSSANPKRAYASRDDEADFDYSAENPEHNYREGVTAIQQGRINAAINHLGAAVRAVPSEARYRAQYGRALAANERMRRLAETELQEAVRLDPKNPAYRIILAELFIDLGFHRRAQTELERALVIDRNSSTADALLRKVKKRIG